MVGGEGNRFPGDVVHVAVQGFHFVPGKLFQLLLHRIPEADQLTKSIGLDLMRYIDGDLSDDRTQGMPGAVGYAHSGCHGGPLQHVPADLVRFLGIVSLGIGAGHLQPGKEGRLPDGTVESSPEKQFPVARRVEIIGTQFVDPSIGVDNAGEVGLFIPAIPDVEEEFFVSTNNLLGDAADATDFIVIASVIQEEGVNKIACPCCHLA